MMTTSVDRGSAKIYQFPARGRTTAGGYLAETKPAADAASPRAKIVWGSGWYHDAAIQDAEPNRKW
jgi:hypothetical protein